MNGLKYLLIGCMVLLAAQGAASQRSLSNGPSNSGPIAVSPDGRFLWVANPDNNSVTLIAVENDAHRKLAEIGVGAEPQNLAISPDGRELYVSNTVSGTVSVIRANGEKSHRMKDIPVGTEPYGLAFAPNGTRLYVANARSNSVTVIDPRGNRVLKTIENAGVEPRGIAITNDGDRDDGDEQVYVTQFLALPAAEGSIQGRDDAKSARISIISTSTDTVGGEVVLHPLADTGFKAAGDAMARIFPPPNPRPEDFRFPTGAFPNQLQSIAIHGKFLYLPNTGASPNGPVRFDVNTQALLSVVDARTNTDAGTTININAAIAGQTNTTRLFFTQPWAIAFKPGSNEAYVVSAASNVVMKVRVHPDTGMPSVQSDPFDPSRVLQWKVGKNPRGIVVNPAGTRAYVMNYISRDVTVIDLSGPVETVLATVPSSALPAPGTLEEKIHIGKELYNTSVGEFDPPAPGLGPITGRMSKNGWGSCSACHPNGLSDNVVWIVENGPRRTIPQHADYDPTDPKRQMIRGLDWSAIADEEEDSELTIRNVLGGLGLIVLDDGVTPDPSVTRLVPLANTDRRQLKVRGVGAWDAIKAYQTFGIRAPISPVAKSDPDVVAGESYFREAKCHVCHGGPQWTSAVIDYSPPPTEPMFIRDGQLIYLVKIIGTFDPSYVNEVRSDSPLLPLGIEGFAPPSLMSIFAFEGSFLHNGAVGSLEEVLGDVVHRSIGNRLFDTLQDPAKRAALIKFLRSIDTASTPIPPP